MNKDKKSGWYYDDTIKVALVFLVLFVCYCIGVSVFISKGDDKLVGAFEAITGLSGLVLSFGTVFFVVKTYSAQKEQIRIQNIQIDIQKQEIEKNKRDVDFNRVMELIYKQLDYTINLFNTNCINGHPSARYNYTLLFNNISDYLEGLKPETIESTRELFIFLNKELKIYHKIINTNNELSEDDREFFTDLFAKNIEGSLRDKIRLFQQLYKQFVNCNGLLSVKDTRYHFTMEEIEYHLSVILEYLKIERIEGLKLRDGKYYNDTE